VRTATLPNLLLFIWSGVFFSQRTRVFYFAYFIQIVVDPFSTYRGWKSYLGSWLHMEIKPFSCYLSTCTRFAVELEL